VENARNAHHEDVTKIDTRTSVDSWHSRKGGVYPRRSAFSKANSTQSREQRRYPHYSLRARTARTQLSNHTNYRPQLQEKDWQQPAIGKVQLASRCNWQRISPGQRAMPSAV
jgi:hypothetical protein